MNPQAPIRRPVSTYRLQFHADFRFADGRDLVPYLVELGVTDCYTSPPLRANPGSTHGYDICDHSQLNPEFGGESDYYAFCDALRARDLGHVIDVVPNHMARDARANPWWRDVLENGPSSPFARFFDIDWDPIKPELKGKVLLPVLGDQYGRVLERGELRLELHEGALRLRYFEEDLPVNPRQSPRILELNLDRLEQELNGTSELREYRSILTALHNLPAYQEQDRARIAERQREKEVARERLARLLAAAPSLVRHVEECIRIANGVPGDAKTFDRLHGLLEHQAYRLAYWRTAFDEINYRRFFDVNELAGLRMEEPEVFEAAHAVLAQLVATGRVTGVRVDHPDGLFDPRSYFESLQQLVQQALGGVGRLYVAAEKILSAGESLHSDWLVDGTTGYQFLNLVAGLFVDARHVRELRRIYSRLTGRQDTFAEVAYHSKRTIMQTAMASELNVLAHALNRISESDRRYRDFTLDACRTVLREIIACFPVYRTYVSDRGISDFDRAAVEAAVEEARLRNPLMEASIFDFARHMLLPSDDLDAAGVANLADRRRFAMKVQQYTGPVQAKGVEDTAFYRYHVLVSANDVGGHPGHLGVTIAEFHDANRARLSDWPLDMLATTTHDTKRGEDARARLAVLSEMPEEWRKAASEWMRLNARHRSKAEGAWGPDRNDEYLFYQSLVGAWPAEGPADPVPPRAPADLAERLSAYVQKAIREAKVRTSWIDENQAYGHAVARFVDKTLVGDGAERFLASFVPFTRRVASTGMVNSLSQLVLKIASPGVPDFYQGSELWDLSLVDPDNRRPVDFAARRKALDQLRPILERAAAGRESPDDFRELLDRWPDGRIKLLVTACGLRLRRSHPELFLDGAYLPIDVHGPASGHLVAFGRRTASAALVLAVPRLVVSLMGDRRGPPLGEPIWGSTSLALPDGLPAGGYRHVLTGETVDVTGAMGAPALAAAALFRTCPVALLEHVG